MSGNEAESTPFHLAGPFQSQLFWLSTAPYRPVGCGLSTHIGVDIPSTAPVIQSTTYKQSNLVHLHLSVAASMLAMPLWAEEWNRWKDHTRVPIGIFLHPTATRVSHSFPRNWFAAAPPHPLHNVLGRHLDQYLYLIISSMIGLGRI